MIGYSFGGSDTQFNLPNPSGRVPGVITNPNVAQIPDSYGSTIASFGGGGLGSTIGAYEHILSIDEMPSHNHGTDTYPPPYTGYQQSSFNNSTSMAYTDITTNIQDTPSAVTQGNYGFIRRSNGGSDTVTTTNVTAGEPDVVSAPIGLVLTDPGHRHTLNSAGNDKAHNNVQPMLFMGNMFIYSGKVAVGNYPYTSGPSPITYNATTTAATVFGSNIW